MVWLITDRQDRPGLHVGHFPFTLRKAKKLITKTGNKNEQSLRCNDVIRCPQSLIDYGRFNNQVMKYNCKAFEM
jgi:hypothetical protein